MIKTALTMKKSFLIISLILVLASCKKNDVHKVNNNKVNNLPDTNFVVSIKPNNISNRFSHIDTTFNLLGYGYDVTGKYADTSAVREQVIDIVSFDKANPTLIYLNNGTSTGTHNLASGNCIAFSKDLSSNLTSLNGQQQFKGSIVSVFNENGLSSKYGYGKFDIYAIYSTNYCFAPSELWSSFLTTSFKQDLILLSPADLVKKYGTHILINVITGAKLSIYYQAEVKGNNRYFATEEGLRFGLAKVFGISTGALDPYNYMNLADISSPKMYVESMGGDPSNMKLTSNGKITTVNWRAWSQSLKSKETAFIDIGNTNGGILPIYELISDPIKKALVSAYIQNYLISNQVQVVN